MKTHFRKKFYDITDLIKEEFERNIRLYGDKIKCRKGCSSCCSQIFRITPLDGWIITTYIKASDEDFKKRIIQKAKSYRQGMPCPALSEEGECTIYEARPVICRRFGIPIYDYKNPGKLHACELNFKEGEEITDPHLVNRQTEIGIKWDELKDEFTEFSDKKDEPMTIAEAVLRAENR